QWPPPLPPPGPPQNARRLQSLLPTPGSDDGAHVDRVRCRSWVSFSRPTSRSAFATYQQTPPVMRRAASSIASARTPLPPLARPPDSPPAEVACTPLATREPAAPHRYSRSPVP